MQIQISIANKKAKAKENYKIVCGNSNYTILFSFDEEWNAYEKKTARFNFSQNGIKKYIDVLFEGNECKMPVLSKIALVEIGVYAGELCTTTPCVLYCEKSILCDNGTHEDPPEDVYVQLLNSMKEPYIGNNGNWFVYDIGKKSFIDSGVKATGDKGEKGDKGDKGDKPVVGEDYFTEKEKKQITDDVAAEAEASLLAMLSRTGALFTFDEKDYILMDDKIESNGKKYYAILRPTNLAAGLWNYEVDGLYLTNKVEATNYTQVVLCKGNTNIQTYKSAYFGGFDGYMISPYFENVMGKDPDTNKLFVYKGSISIPTFNQLKNITAVDKQFPNKYKRTITSSTLNYGGVLYVDFFPKAPEDRGTLKYNKSQQTYCFTSAVCCTDWYLMTYVSEDFFKNVHINLNTMGAYAKYLIKRDFTYSDLAKVYNAGELNILLGMSGDS